MHMVKTIAIELGQKMRAVYAQWFEGTVGAAGAFLGVLNTWRNWSQDRVRIRVKTSLGRNAAGPLLVLNVLNISSFPVTITHVGFDILGGGEHMQIPAPIFAGSHTLPVRLESRTSCTALQPFTALPAERWLVVRRTYVETACGVKITCNGKFFAQNWSASA
jgi:hypothetical protein